MRPEKTHTRLTKSAAEKRGRASAHAPHITSKKRVLGKAGKKGVPAKIARTTAPSMDLDTDVAMLMTEIGDANGVDITISSRPTMLAKSFGPDDASDAAGPPAFTSTPSGLMAHGSYDLVVTHRKTGLVGGHWINLHAAGNHLVNASTAQLAEDIEAAVRVASMVWEE